jgi:uncharacterized membrane protein (UPF0127 family)
MKEWHKNVLCILAACVAVGLILYFCVPAQRYDQKKLTIVGGSAEKVVEIEVVDTPATRTQGLSGRKSLAPDTGMLFIFEKSDTYGFWMPDMHFSIDILWINTQKKIVYIEKNVSPESYPKIFKPTVPAQYVLEVPAGFSDQNNVRIGDEVRF